MQYVAYNISLTEIVEPQPSEKKTIRDCWYKRRVTGISFAEQYSSHCQCAHNLMLSYQAGRKEHGQDLHNIDKNRNIVDYKDGPFCWHHQSDCLMFEAQLAINKTEIFKI